MQSDKPFSQQFLFSRLPGVSHKFCDISLWATAIQVSFLIIKTYNVNPIFLCAGQGQARHCPLSCSAFPVSRSVAASAR